MNIKQLNEALTKFFEYGRSDDSYYTEDLTIELRPVNPTQKEQFLELAQQFEDRVDFENALNEKGIEWHYVVPEANDVSGKTVDELDDALYDEFKPDYARVVFQIYLDDFDITKDTIIAGRADATLYTYYYDEDQAYDDMIDQ